MKRKILGSLGGVAIGFALAKVLSYATSILFPLIYIPLNYIFSYYLFLAISFFLPLIGLIIGYQFSKKETFIFTKKIKILIIVSLFIGILFPLLRFLFSYIDYINYHSNYGEAPKSLFEYIVSHS